MTDSNAMDPMVINSLFIGAVFLLAFGLELVSGRISRAQRPLRDALFTVVGMSSQILFSGLVIGALAGATAAMIWSDSAGGLSHISYWIAFPVIFITQEFLHYIVHRYAHEWRWLWKVHRTHHSGLDLNAGVLYRFNIFWAFLLPQSWIGAFAVYLGQTEAFITAILITYLNNVLTHSSFRWDLWLREKMPWSEPVWKVLEKVITLPDAHHAHHAYGKTGHPNGNYAVTLFIFDVMFGTAKLPHSRQTQYGLPISPRLHWAEELFWPLVKKPLLPKPGAATKQVEPV